MLGTGVPGHVFDPEEATDRAITSGNLFERMWDWLVAADPSATAMPPPKAGADLTPRKSLTSETTMIAAQP